MGAHLSPPDCPFDRSFFNPGTSAVDYRIFIMCAKNCLKLISRSWFIDARRLHQCKQNTAKTATSALNFRIFRRGPAAAGISIWKRIIATSERRLRRSIATAAHATHASMTTDQFSYIFHIYLAKVKCLLCRKFLLCASDDMALRSHPHGHFVRSMHNVGLMKM